MGVASTVSRLPITVKVVPVTTDEEEGHGEEQQPGEQEEEGPQQQHNQMRAAEDATQTGNICSTNPCLLHHDLCCEVELCMKQSGLKQVDGGWSYAGSLPRPPTP